MREIVQISSEDLALLRMNDSRMRAMEIKPEAYSREEIEQQFLKRLQLHGDLCQRYGVDNTRRWTILPETGHFVVGDDVEPGG